MELPHARDKGLARFLIMPYLEGGVLLREAGEGLGKPVLVRLGLGLNGYRDDRLRKGNGLQEDGVGNIAEGIPGKGILQAQGGRDVSGLDSVYLLPAVGMHTQQPPDALLGAPGGIEYLGPCLS